MQACKPGSVEPYHLSGHVIADGLYQPTRDADPALTRSITSRHSINGRHLFGFSTRKVYHASDITIRAVSSYLAFSPFPL
ncbi:hypothetical protein BH10BAC4_BH10BAC4_05080 [soil metagenome]